MLSPQVAALVQSTAAVWCYLQEPDVAAGLCVEMSFRFICLASERGIAMEEVRCLGLLTPYDTRCTRFEDHTVVRWQDVIIDWTARQFWSTSPFPLIETVRDYHQRWEQMGHSHLFSVG